MTRKAYCKRYNKAYYKKNKKKIKAQVKAWRKKNKKKVLAKMKVYYKKNSTAIRKRVAKTNRTYKKGIRYRYAVMLVRSKKLTIRGVRSDKVLTLRQHRSKLYFADGSKKPCCYCGHEVGDYGSGLDRKDNSVNYTDANTVPCCGSCNTWKGRTHTYEETMNHFKPMRDAARTSLPLAA